MSEECQSRYVVRIPDAPSDQWESYDCIQDHGVSPFVPGVIHNDGSCTQWVEIGHQAHTVLELRDEQDTLKMLRETLCRAQAAIHAENEKYAPWETDPGDLARFQRLIDEIDRQRPLGQDGEHGDRHTPTCGCDDV